MLHRFLATGTLVVLGFASASFLADSAFGQRIFGDILGNRNGFQRSSGSS